MTEMPTTEQVLKALLHSTRDIVARAVRAPDLGPSETLLAWRLAASADGFTGGHDLNDVMCRAAYICPKCHLVSRNPADLANRYCGACGFEEDR